MGTAFFTSGKRIGLNCLFLVFCCILLTAASAVGQSSKKGWTPWADVEGDWAEFYVFVSFLGGDKSPDELAKKPLKSLKVVCKIVGRVRGRIPPEIYGVKLFRLNYKIYGDLDYFDYGKDWIDLYYSEDGAVARIQEIKRPATQFDVEEVARAETKANVTSVVPVLPGVGRIGPLESSLQGREYRIGVEWRRKGSKVELRLKDYRPD
ncbi:MAG TPA: hypothetical protein PKC65_08920 [Pyrinomonadaceae bacterium]|nr:hypothetical protein [Pyrinomonadaceae bacterium]